MFHRSRRGIPGVPTLLGSMDAQDLTELDGDVIDMLRGTELEDEVNEYLRMRDELDAKVAQRR